ncbi:MAG: 50S ribosomal protein L23 [Aminobacterium sp.]|jgi:large subunit ribosomal protein L23|uniref:50S ribosomal protein L23 n=1 Tax=bioreactor metagenome TaxID=1076179 RepID=A0A645END7_9ZZZZ|nr:MULTISPECIES: 50S ribosomal protein L23 [unclassified Aminobacterium]MDD2207413.1 50S ribosomal protein L23 [Aminobacterium sp.]MDD3427125.1 50S ribosomal protein L23 [Aminobacterium sp.]MDD3707876.1 50S ribosomal protein L23 [Aminobacterium sp.]MDD4229408.1 50S ribosomal protein L23 [Aminobacterium sp.]MDD4552138.1 50S ribosomal protein L23 [Aminobacterium sp.]
MKLLAHDIIIRPIVTEKSSRLMEHNKYTFEVHPSANKIQVKEAVQEVFKVKVKNVHIIRVHAKPKRMGVFLGKTRSWKKAIVSLPEGERIEFFEGASI